jgi:hypothetical protein
MSKKKKNQLINFSKNDTKVNTILFAVFHSLIANDIKWKVLINPYEISSLLNGN